MRSLKGPRLNGTPAPTSTHVAPIRVHGARLARKPAAFAVHAVGSPSQARPQAPDFQVDTSQPAPQRVFMFNPNDPNTVEEMMITPHEDIDAAEELLTIAHGEAQAAEAAAGGPQAGRPAVQRTPIPLRAVSPMPSRGRSRPNMAARIPGAPFMAQPSQALVQAGSREATMSNAKNQEMTKQLVAQLQKEQGHVASLQQYENMYREWRMKAERLDSDIGTLQRLVAEKDSELAHGYKLLEASAAERSRLRHSYQASTEKTRQLQLQLAEAQARAIAGTPAPPLIGNGHENGHANGNGRGRSNGNSQLALGGVQGLIEELSMMAKGMATEMQHEVKTLAVAPRE